MLILLERERPWIDALVLEPSRCNSVREKWNKPFKRDFVTADRIDWRGQNPRFGSLWNR